MESIVKIQEVLGTSITTNDVKERKEGYTVDWFYISFWKGAFKAHIKDLRFRDAFYYIKEIFKKYPNIQIEIEFFRYLFNKNGIKISQELLNKTKVSIIENNYNPEGFNFIIGNLCYNFENEKDLKEFQALISEYNITKEELAGI